MFTDGVPEAQNVLGEFADDDRVREWLTASRGENASIVADSILRQLRRWRGVAAFDDDVTFVVVQIASRSSP
jgi:serine phosphatase RsbU (regulator of sigma subunit)